MRQSFVDTSLQGDRALQAEEGHSYDKVLSVGGKRRDDNLQDDVHLRGPLQEPTALHSFFHRYYKGCVRVVYGKQIFCRPELDAVDLLDQFSRPGRSPQYDMTINDNSPKI